MESDTNTATTLFTFVPAKGSGSRGVHLYTWFSANMVLSIDIKPHTVTVIFSVQGDNFVSCTSFQETFYLLLLLQKANSKHFILFFVLNDYTMFAIDIESFT